MNYLHCGREEGREGVEAKAEEEGGMLEKEGYQHQPTHRSSSTPRKSSTNTTATTASTQQQRQQQHQQKYQAIRQAKKKEKNAFLVSPVPLSVSSESDTFPCTDSSSSPLVGSFLKEDSECFQYLKTKLASRHINLLAAVNAELRREAEREEGEGKIKGRKEKERRNEDLEIEMQKQNEKTLKSKLKSPPLDYIVIPSHKPVADVIHSSDTHTQQSNLEGVREGEGEREGVGEGEGEGAGELKEEVDWCAAKSGEREERRDCVESASSSMTAYTHDSVAKTSKERTKHPHPKPSTSLPSNTPTPTTKKTKSPSSPSSSNKKVSSTSERAVATSQKKQRIHSKKTNKPLSQSTSSSKKLSLSKRQAHAGAGGDNVTNGVDEEKVTAILEALRCSFTSDLSLESLPRMLLSHISPSDNTHTMRGFDRDDQDTFSLIDEGSWEGWDRGEGRERWSIQDTSRLLGHSFDGSLKSYDDLPVALHGNEDETLEESSLGTTTFLRALH
jgi:hypothetical protein